MKNRHRLIPFSKLKADLMKDPEFVREYDKLETEFQIARQLIDARAKHNLSQEELAIKVKTGQAVISRIEGTAKMPTIPLLQRIARALDTKFTITIQ